MVNFGSVFFPSSPDPPTKVEPRSMFPLGLNLEITISPEPFNVLSKQPVVVG